MSLPGQDPALDRFRQSPSGQCWWCGAPATTAEHKYKYSDLKRMASVDGALDPTSLYKGGDDYTGDLRGIKTGRAVRWGKSMCAPCNNQRSQPFDQAYEKLSDYLWHHQRSLRLRRRLDLAQMYGPSWPEGATNAARYLAKQLACCLYDQRLPLPDGLVPFLNGAPGCPGVIFDVLKDRAKRDLHDDMARRGGGAPGYWLTPMPAIVSAEGAFVGTIYGYCIGYLCLRATWRVGLQGESFFDERRPRLPTEGSPLPREFRQRRDDG